MRLDSSCFGLVLVVLTVSWPKPHRLRASGDQDQGQDQNGVVRTPHQLFFCCLEFWDRVCFHSPDPYLNDVNFFSAVIPHFKLLAVPSYVFCDANSAHLDKDKSNWSYSSVLIGLHLSPGNVCFCVACLVLCSLCPPFFLLLLSLLALSSHPLPHFLLVLFFVLIYKLSEELRWSCMILIMLCILFLSPSHQNAGWAVPEGGPAHSCLAFERWPLPGP